MKGKLTGYFAKFGYFKVPPKCKSPYGAPILYFCLVFWKAPGFDLWRHPLGSSNVSSIHPTLTDRHTDRHAGKHYSAQSNLYIHRRLCKSGIVNKTTNSIPGKRSPQCMPILSYVYDIKLCVRSLLDPTWRLRVQFSSVRVACLPPSMTVQLSRVRIVKVNKYPWSSTRW